MCDLQIHCVVENGLNTCYIDSLFVGLFYKHNDGLSNILECIPKKPEGYYLQELIKLKFVEAIKRKYSITFSTMNEIRNYSVICGWSNNSDITEQKKCSDYYNFIYELFDIPPLELEIIEIKDNILTNNIEKVVTPYIHLDLHKDDNIKNLLTNWINKTINNTGKNTINCYKLTNIPQFVIMNVNRFDNKGKRTQFKLDIMRRIKFFNINDNTQNYLKWKIHSVICHNGNKENIGHYYTIINTHRNKWILFDDEIIPSFKEIDFEDSDFKDKIMLEAIMIIYTID